MPDNPFIKPQQILIKSYGDMIPFSADVLEDAKRAFFTLEEVEDKMKALTDIYNLCCSVGCVNEFFSVCEEALNDPDTGKARANILCRMGVAYENEKNFDKALVYYLASMEFECEIEPIRYYRLVNAAFCCLMKNAPLKAQEFCKSAIVINPDKWQAWKNLGMSYELLDNPREAVNCYVRAIKLSCGNVAPVVYLRELVKRNSEKIPDLDQIEEELLEKYGVVI